MKKILLILTLVMSMISTCYAYDLTSPKWHKVMDEPSFGKFYINIETLEFPDNRTMFGCSKKHRYISAWIYNEIPNQKICEYVLSFEHFDLDCRKKKTEIAYGYNKNDEMVCSENLMKAPPQRIIPGSRAEVQLSAFDGIWQLFKEIVDERKKQVS